MEIRYMKTREEQRDMACTNWICSQENGTVIMARNVWKAAVEWADSNPQWIPVEEELPKENQYVITYNGVFNEIHLCDFHDGIFEDFYGPFNGTITHWMEIVPPRKEE